MFGIRIVARTRIDLSDGLALDSSRDGRRANVLMPSTRSAYPQVVSRSFASFHVADSTISAAQLALCAWFDSRQLH
jgi:hypothetical protein